MNHLNGLIYSLIIRFKLFLKIKMSRVAITQANVHPLVLLSIVDHFNRVNLKQRNKRVVGALLGTVSDNVIEVVNSYAIPF